MTAATNSGAGAAGAVCGDAIVELLFLPVLLVDTTGTCVHANRAFRSLIGPETGNSVYELLRTDPSGELAERIRGALEHDLAWHDLELSIDTLSGHTRACRVHVRQCQSEQSGPLALLVLQDITERAEAEKQVIAMQRLEAVGRLAAGVAHDFNNLLTIIQSYVGFVRERFDDSDPAVADVTAIRETVDRAASLNQQLLAFSKRESQSPEVLDLNRVVAELNKLLIRVLGEDVNLTIELADDLYKIFIDRSHIEQMIVNLALNARDAMPDGGDLAIGTSNVDVKDSRQHRGMVAGTYVLLTVSDTGHGMDAETLECMFEPFFTTKPADGGTGLGLSTVHNLVRQSGGSVFVDSSPGAGTVFSIYLPQTKAGEDSATQRVKVRPRTGKETVLLVEDETELRRAARRILESGGYAVIEASSAADALAECEKGGDIDVLVTDVIMPGMNGNELAEQVVAAMPSVRVLYMSGYPIESVARHGVLDHGAYVQKPFSADRLLRAVRDTLDLRATSTEP